MVSSELSTRSAELEAELQDGSEALSGEAEPWEAWETRLVLASLAIGAAGLIVLGLLVDRFILAA